MLLAAGLSMEILYVLVALLIALTIHEASHALAAYLLGDPTPKEMGRLSLNPLAHLDPFGALMILLVGLGWGKPVMIKAEKLKPGPQIGMALVGIAGPLSNLLLAIAASVPLRFHWVSLLPERFIEVEFLPAEFQFFSIGRVILYLVFISLGLTIFNLIPITPLDGSRLWQIFLPASWYQKIARVEIVGLFVVIALVLSDRFFDTNILMSLLGPPIRFLWWQLVGMAPPFPI
ncbi:MAG: site-2 protease family protein [Chloroflexi bacterium]|nr:site-2 protease family protein [Chloroflexota bacterium]